VVNAGHIAEDGAILETVHQSKAPVTVRGEDHPLDISPTVRAQAKVF